MTAAPAKPSWGRIIGKAPGARTAGKVTRAHRRVTEDVENRGTLDLLYAMGCDMAQGYVIARPMPLAELMRYLGRRERKTG